MRILVALGGNAILQKGGTGTAMEQFATVGETCKQLVKIVRAGHDLAITHGNGPQIGDILLAYDSAKKILPPMPLDVCGAQSQGMIGYMLQQSLENELRRSRMKKSVAVVLTQTVVSSSDRAFSSPSKPIGPFYTKEEADLLKDKNGWTMVNDSNRGFRRVVPSPEPVEIVEGLTIRSLYESGTIVIAAGGGGIPVVKDRESKGYVGVEAVIDKDLASALLAEVLGIDVMVVVTDVDGIFLDYGRPTQRLLRRMSAMEGRRYLRKGQFPAGSMGPKVEAVTRFVESGGKRAIITSLKQMEAALSGEAGTEVSVR
ncbi:MAG: carbamate kinase [Nitrososphaerales archaeon]|jgi:carbamate kinase